MDYAKAAAAVECSLANYSGNSNATQPVICRNTKPLTDPTDVVLPEAPCKRIYAKAVAMAQQIYQQRLERLLADFEAAYRAKGLTAQDLFSVGNEMKQYHYTLYYYHQAASLVKTVPPAGVTPDFSATYTNQVKLDRDNNTANPRPHTLVTNYRYNSLGQVIAQNSPDGNTSKFWYDRLGRLAVSQNAQQLLDNKYSYTLYDQLGRITEVGQKTNPPAVMSQTISQDATALNDWIVSNGGVREQLTRTVYDIYYGEDGDAAYPTTPGAAGAKEPPQPCPLYAYHTIFIGPG